MRFPKKLQILRFYFEIKSNNLLQKNLYAVFSKLRIHMQIIHHKFKKTFVEIWNLWSQNIRFITSFYLNFLTLTTRIAVLYIQRSKCHRRVNLNFLAFLFSFEVCYNDKEVWMCKFMHEHIMWKFSYKNWFI